MTQDELKKRCEVLASVGDEQARATLELFDRLSVKSTLQPTADELKRQADTANVLTEIENALADAAWLGLYKPNRSSPEGAAIERAENPLFRGMGATGPEAGSFSEEYLTGLLRTIRDTLDNRCRSKRVRPLMIGGPLTPSTEVPDFVNRIIDDLGAARLRIAFLESLYVGSVPPPPTPANWRPGGESPGLAAAATPSANGKA